MAQKTCAGPCGGTYKDTAFRKRANGKRADRCLKCDKKKGRGKTRDPIGRKITDVTTRHASKFIKAGIIESRNELIDTYNWDPVRMREHLFNAKTCAYSNLPFNITTSGEIDLSDVTLDVTHPNEPPYYDLNTKWVKSSVNTEKGRMSVTEWADRQTYYRQYEENLKKIMTDPSHGLPLWQVINGGKKLVA